MSEEQTKSAPETNANGTKIHWADGSMQTAYANVVNVTSTREEMMLLFGTNQTSAINGQNQIMVELTHRMILNPYAAKRLSLVLAGVLKEYETRFGALPVDGAAKS
jgi:hypothetical protein